MKQKIILVVITLVLGLATNGMAQKSKKILLTNVVLKKEYIASHRALSLKSHKIDKNGRLLCQKGYAIYYYPALKAVVIHATDFDFSYRSKVKEDISETLTLHCTGCDKCTIEKIRNSYSCEGWCDSKPCHEVLKVKKKSIGQYQTPEGNYNDLF
ncbi:MAG: hypothetical protein AAF985_05945 [Bacteroidota bacterium]